MKQKIKKAFNILFPSEAFWFKNVLIENRINYVTYNLKENPHDYIITILAKICICA